MSDILFKYEMLINTNNDGEWLLGMKSDNESIMPENTAAFEEVIAIIERARENAFRAVNHELIAMYWEIGRFISKKLLPITGVNP